VLSRIADALYWMARYLERVDHTARLIELDLAPPAAAEDDGSPDDVWRPLLGVAANAAAYAAIHPDGVVTQDRMIRFLTVERTNPNAVRSCLRLARDNGHVVRDRLSDDAWEILNALWVRSAPHLERADGTDAMVQFCHALRGEVARFHGVMLGAMVRDEAFAFYQLGTFVERADMTARILAARADAASDDERAAALLHALGGADAQRGRPAPGCDAATLVGLVVGDPTFPRSLRFAVDRITRALATADGARVASAARGIVASLQRDLAAEGAHALANGGLHAFLARFVSAVAGADTALRNELFHTATEVSCGT
jgi:uncharacterized alpha-E superfamily protein